MTARVRAEILENRRIAEGIFSMRLAVPFAAEVKPGQFVSVFLPDESRLLPRPISVCGADPSLGEIRLVYRASGSGTKWMSACEAGVSLELLGPLGNGFPVELAAGKQLLLVGGGIGIPPLVMCAAEAATRGSVVFGAGYRSDDTYLLEEMKALGRVVAATDDGSLGFHGNVVDAVRDAGVQPDLVFACGPKPMLRAVKSYAESLGVPCYISLEERMACGAGVCLGCAARRAEGSEGGAYVRVCADGPVFAAAEVDLT